MNLASFKKRTAYNAEKKNKADNFTYLNKNFCIKGQTVLVGDSITELYNHTELFSKYREESGLLVYNRGISGDTTNRLLERFEDNVLIIEPKNIVILIGTNDLGAGSTAQYPVDNIEKIINLIRDRYPETKIIIQSVYPINSKMHGKSNRNNKNIALLNNKLKELCKVKKVIYVDLTDKLSDSNGELNCEFTYDGLHPNAKAFKVVTDNLLPHLK